MSRCLLVCSCYFQHGRLKVKTTKEQEEERRQKRAQKLKLYRATYGKILEKRQHGERDEDGLQLTQQILELIPDILTVWNFRREILEHFKETLSPEEVQRLLEAERRVTELCLRSNPKSYGAWHHRCWAMEAMPQPDWDRELQLCNKFLDLDERNFHCWDYRRFVVQRAAVSPEQELKYTSAKIAANFSNYSSWHYRSKLLPLVFPDPLGVRPLAESAHASELTLVQNAVFTDPNDQSAWFYQRWLLGRSQPPQAVTRAMLSPGLSFVALARPGRVRDALQFLLEGRAVRGSWTPVDGQRYASVWRFNPEAPLPSGPLPSDVAVQWARDPAVPLSVSEDGSSACFIAKPDFGAPLSASLASVLKDELAKCEELLDFDPQSKWTLLTSVLLMQTIDRHANEEKSMHFLAQLIELDYQRANYYKDLRSRFRIEIALERLQGTVLNLSGLRLTALYHTPLMSTVSALNLGNNQLRRPLVHLSALLCCKTLVLDNNELESLELFGAMPNLTTLSLRNNLLSEVASLVPLSAYPSLKILDIRGNPVCSDSGISERIHVLLPNLLSLKFDPTT